MVNFKQLCMQFLDQNGVKYQELDEKAIELCNTINSEYRWVNFYLYNDEQIVCSADTYVTPETCGNFCLKTIFRMAAIIDEVYPEFAKAKFN